MEKINFDRMTFHAFLLDEERVKSLSNILQDRVGELSVSAVCADDAHRRFESVDKLLKYENARSRRIISLALRSGVKEWASEVNRTIRITYSIMSINSYISVEVEGPEEWGSITMQQLAEVIEGSRPWYSRVSKVNEFILAWPLMVILYFPLIRAGLISSPPEFIDFLRLFGLSFFPAWGMKYVIRHLFPRGVYLIGQEKARNKTRKKCSGWL